MTVSSSTSSRTALRRAQLAALAAAIAIYLLVTLSGSGEAVFRQLTDRFQRWAPRDLSGSPVVLVGIDPESLATIGDWPWSRLYLERLIATLRRDGARVIGLDIVLHDPDPASPDRLAHLYPELPAPAAAALRRLPSPDATLADTIGTARPTGIVLARVGVDAGSIDAEVATAAQSPEEGAPARLPPGIATYRSVLESIPELDFVAGGHGLVNGAPDADGVVRRVPLVAMAGGVPGNGFALEMARLALGSEAATPIVRNGALAGVALGARQVPTDTRGELRLRYGQSPDTRIRSAVNVMRRRFPRGVFRDKLVIVGLCAAAVGDVVTTPLENRAFGMSVQGQAVDAILRGGWLVTPRWAAPAEAGLALLLVLLGAAALPRLRMWPGLALGAGIVAAPLLLSWIAFAGRATLLNPVATVAAAVAAGLVLAALLFGDAIRSRRELRDDAARRAGEMEFARRFQRGVLPTPRQLAALDPRVTVAATLEPAQDVGGDFYDVLPMADGGIGFLLGDVAGKGVEAALLMALSKALARGALLREQGDPGAALGAAEREMLGNSDGAELTIVAGVLDLASGRACLAIAGHPDPFVVARDGTVRDIRLEGRPTLCAADGLDCPSEPLQLAPGDTLLLFTDGVSEAEAHGAQLFGRARIAASLAGGGDPQALIARLVADVRAHEAGTAPSDDLACLAIRWQGSEGRSG